MLISYLDDEKIQASTDLISVYDSDLVVLKWNQGCENKFGIRAKNAIGRTLAEIFPTYNLKEDYRYNCLVDAARDGKSFYFPGLPYRYHEGIYYQAIVPLKANASTIVGALNVVRDGVHVTGKVTKRDLLVPIIKTEASAIAHLLK
jgi:PAS domain-containing protein